MEIYSDEVILLFSLLLPPISKLVGSSRKEFASFGVSSFLEQCIPLNTAQAFREAKTELICVFVKLLENMEISKLI